MVEVVLEMVILVDFAAEVDLESGGIEYLTAVELAEQKVMKLSFRRTPHSSCSVPNHYHYQEV